MLSPAIRPVLGSIPVVPEMKTWEPALTPWLNSVELGAFGVVMIWRGIWDLLADRPIVRTFGEDSLRHRARQAAKRRGSPASESWRERRQVSTITACSCRA